MGHFGAYTNELIEKLDRCHERYSVLGKRQEELEKAKVSDQAEVSNIGRAEMYEDEANPVCERH